jgi:hypothetical protein
MINNDETRAVEAAFAALPDATGILPVKDPTTLAATQVKIWQTTYQELRRVQRMYSAVFDQDLTLPEVLDLLLGATKPGRAQLADGSVGTLDLSGCPGGSRHVRGYSEPVTYERGAN